MIVEQAVFSSARSSQCQGYHLVARSVGIDEATAAVLTRWSPSVGGLIEGVDESLNWFPVNDQRVALSRSVFGGPEYSRRGGLQVVTNMIVCDRDSLAGYSQNPLALATVAMRNGGLLLQTGLKRRLETLELPDRTVLGSQQLNIDALASVNEVAQAVRFSGQVAVTGVRSPMRFLSDLSLELPEQDARRFSFTTGLAPAGQRPFSLYVYGHCSRATLDQLRSRKIRVIDLHQNVNV